MSRSASYVIVKQDADTLVIRDTGDHSRQATVTNDAEHVVKTLAESGSLGDRTLLYYDSEGDLDELGHDGQGNFLGFRPGPR